eukprot:4776030-Pyramimonas_sp.AAC.1
MDEATQQESVKEFFTDQLLDIKKGMEAKDFIKATQKLSKEVEKPVNEVMAEVKRLRAMRGS